MKKKTLLSSLLTIFLLLLNSTTANATLNMDIDYTYKLIDGRTINYMIQPGNEYTVSIPNAVYKIQYPNTLSNNLVLKPAAVYNNSKLDFYQNYANDGVNGKARVFRKDSSGVYKNSTGEMDYYDWNYGEVYINDFYMATATKELCEAVIIHEMLHVYGLKDINDKLSIMYYATPYAKGVTPDANQVLNNKY